MADLIAENLTVLARNTPLIENVGFRLKPGELVCLLGPNGAGKSTLLRAALGLQATTQGQTRIGGDDVRDLSPRARALQVSYLPQSRPLAWPSRVQDVVALGRFAHGVSPGRLRGADERAVNRAIADCGLGALSSRRCDTLSGGELARVHCARAFAADTPFLFADEPVAALDPKHQFRIMDLIAAYVQSGRGALVVLHEVALAARYATRLIWMKKGRIVADGPPAETLAPDRIREVYDVAAEIRDGHVMLKGVSPGVSSNTNP